MGYSLSWLAFKGISLDAGLASLRLARTGTPGEWGRTSITGHALPGDWHLVIAPRCKHPLVSEVGLVALSGGSEVIACCVEEHVMFSTAEAWRNGERVWHVEHDAQRGKRHLVSDGQLPPHFAMALQKAQEQQDAEDRGSHEVDFYFDVPLQVAHRMAGFKHDEENPALDGTQFEVYVPLERTRETAEKRMWWEVWKRA